MTRAEAVVDRDAMRHNLSVVREAIGSCEVMAVVKADGYGHGAVEAARVARDAGANWLGLALPSEAMALRAAGDHGRMLAWLWTPGDPDVAACIDADVDISISSEWALAQVQASAGDRPARVQLKVDTGLSRNGVGEAQWAGLVAQAARLQADGRIVVTGIWSHLANADVLDDSSVVEQLTVLQESVSFARTHGLEPELVHLANSAAAFEHPTARLDLVRIGIAMYGVAPLDPDSPARLGLRPAMQVNAQVALVKTIPAGASVSYGSTWTAEAPTQVALIPLGYADGIPRAASNRGAVRINGEECPIVGRVAMDQFVVRVDGPVSPGDDVVVFGEDPTADDWAVACDTIGYEIVTRLGSRVPRRYVGAP